MSSADDLDQGRLRDLGVDAELIAQRLGLDGDYALALLAELPVLAAYWQGRLGLRNGRIMPGGVLSAVLRCERVEDGTTVFLKLSGEHEHSAGAEAAALAAWDGAGACALRWTGDDGRVMLLDAIQPGAAVAPGDDRVDAGRAGDLLRTLHRIRANRIPPAIPPAALELNWRFERAHRMLDGPSHARGLVSHAEIDAARRAALALDEQSVTRVMCHGDFIDKNILLDGDGAWWAIDPRPCVADPCLDAGFWALTHRPGMFVRDRCSLTARAICADPERVWAWAQAFAVSEAVLVTDLDRARAHHSVLSG